MIRARPERSWMAAEYETKDPLLSIASIVRVMEECSLSLLLISLLNVVYSYSFLF